MSLPFDGFRLGCEMHGSSTLGAVCPWFTCADGGNVKHEENRFTRILSLSS